MLMMSIYIQNEDGFSINLVLTPPVNRELASAKKKRRVEKSRGPPPPNNNNKFIFDRCTDVAPKYATGVY